MKKKQIKEAWVKPSFKVLKLKETQKQFSLRETTITISARKMNQPQLQRVFPFLIKLQKNLIILVKIWRPALKQLLTYER